MYVAFENISPSARVWVYQTERLLSSDETAFVGQYLQQQIEQWAAHGAPLLGAFQIIQNRFIIVAADEQQNAASGCSIDASGRWFKELTQHLNINFFDRSIAYFKGDTIETVEMLKIRGLVTSGEITPETPIVNTLVATVAEFQEKWMLPAGESWMARYFKQLV